MCINFKITKWAGNEYEKNEEPWGLYEENRFNDIILKESNLITKEVNYYLKSGSVKWKDCKREITSSMAANNHENFFHPLWIYFLHIQSIAITCKITNEDIAIH